MLSMVAQDTAHMIVSDDPESKIRFMEQMLDGKGWRTRIAYPDASPESLKKRDEVSQSLRKQGYRVSATTDNEGHPVLEVKHDAVGTRFSDIVRDMGLLQGTFHTVTHPGVAVGEVIRASRKTAQKMGDTLKDPARANGLIFITAEMFLSSAGLFNKERESLTFFQKIKQPRNFFHSLAGVLWLSQSLVYFFLARSNEDASLEAIKKKTASLADGNEPERIQYDQEKDAPKHDIISSTQRFIEKYPIQIGAMANNLGMLSFATHAIYNRRYHRESMHLPDSAKYVNKGFWWDIGGAITSLVAWSLLLIPNHKKEEKKEADSKPSSSLLGRVVQNFKDNPEHGTGLLTIASSSQRLLGAAVKKNWVHVTGEAIYLPGDFLLLFTKNGEYGDHKNLDIEKLASKLSEYIQRQPIILGHTAQSEMVADFANYLFEKAKADNALKPAKKQLSDQVLELRRAALIQATDRKLRHSQNEKLERVTDALAGIIVQLPEDQQASAAQHLTSALTTISAIAVKPDEMQAMLSKSIEEKKKSLANQEGYSIKKEVVQLSKAVPEQVADVVVSAVYDILAKHPSNRSAHPASTVAPKEAKLERLQQAASAIQPA